MMKSVLGLGTSKEVRVHSQHHKAAGRRPFTHPSVLGDITESARRRRRRGRCCTGRHHRVRCQRRSGAAVGAVGRTVDKWAAVLRAL